MILAQEMQIYLILSIFLNIFLSVCLFFKSALNDLLVDMLREHKKKKEQQDQADKVFGQEVLSLFNVYNIKNELLCTIPNGFITGINQNKINELLNIRMGNSKFYNQKTQKQFLLYIDAFDKFRDYFAKNSFYCSQSNNYWINKYQRQEEELTIVQKKEIKERFRNTEFLINKVLTELNKLENIILKRFPLLSKRGQ